MKRVIGVIIVFLFIATKIYGQNSCKIELRTGSGKKTEASFYIVLGKDTIQSNNGILTISPEKYQKYKTAKVKLYFSDKGIVTKIYKLPLIATKPTPLSEICGVYTLEKKF